MRIVPGCTVIAIAALLNACGGDDSSTPVTPTVAATTVSGTAVKGPVANAAVSIKNAATGAVLATTTTNAVGAYSVAVPFSGDVVVEVTGGTYLDEATNVSTPLATPLKAVVTASGSSVTGMVTPLTTIAYTSAFGAGTAVSAAAFNTAAATVASQYQLSGVNLLTTAPVVTGDVNAYGKALRAVSKYLQLNNVSLQSLLTASMTSAQLSAYSVSFSTAYNSINPGTPVTFSFNGGGAVIGGTGGGGGTGTCGVNLKGSVTSSGFTVPLNLDYCITGIAAGSCDAGNSSLSQSLAGQGGIAGATNLVYTYTPSCAAGALSIALK